MASKLVFSVEGTKTGGICFRSKAAKSIGWKKGFDVKVSKPAAPMRLRLSLSSRDEIACRQGRETGGWVT